MVLKAQIEIRHLTKAYGSKTQECEAVSDISLDIFHQEFVAFVGPSGCGKSTVLNMIGGIIPPSSGTIFIEGCVVNGIPPQVGFIFQKDTVFPWRTVHENLRLGLEYLSLSKSEKEERIAQAIDLAGLNGFERTFPIALSGGMRQRVALLRSLLVNPKILLMDEPFGALDVHTKIRLQKELLELWRQKRQTVLFVTHDLEEALTLADKIVVFTRRPGKVKLIYDVALPRPRDPIHIRETREFAEEYRKLWKVLGEEF